MFFAAESVTFRFTAMASTATDHKPRKEIHFPIAYGSRLFQICVAYLPGSVRLSISIPDQWAYHEVQRCHFVFALSECKEIGSTTNEHARFAAQCSCGHGSCQLSIIANHTDIAPHQYATHLRLVYKRGDDPSRWMSFDLNRDWFNGPRLQFLCRD
jgi:hypothetical protein